MRRSPPKRKPLTVSDRERSELWHRGIGCVCAVCGNRYKHEMEAHHILRVQVLRREAKRLGFDFDRVRWDTRNRLPTCETCHSRHHSRFRPIKRSVLEQHAPKVFQFARELRLEHVIEREYA